MSVSNFIGITGAASGIGRELSRQFVKQGLPVVGVDIDQQGLASLAQECEGRFTSVVCDLANKKMLNDALVKIQQDFGVPSVWINNAGLAHIKSMKEISEEELELTMQVNFFALVACARFWLGPMETAGAGTLVNIGSVAGHVPAPGVSAYVASKFAVTGFTQSLQAELEINKSAVKLLLVSPGFVETKIMQLGKQNGFPKELLFLTTKAEDCAGQIIAGIAKGEKEIFPTANGKALMAMQRLSPRLARGLTKLAIASKIDLKK